MTITNYTFNAGAKTVTFNGLPIVELARVQLIVNVTDGITLYQFNNPALGGAVTGNVLTLSYDTSSMSNSDVLMVLYQDDSNEVTQGDLNDEHDSVTTSGKSTTYLNLTASSTGADLLPATDVSKYSTIMVHLQTLGGSNFVQFAYSNDLAGSWSTYRTVGAGGVFLMERRAKYFKVTMNVWASGTAVANVILFADALTDPSIARLSYPASDYGAQITVQDNNTNAVPLYTLGAIADSSTVSVNKLIGVAPVAFDGATVTRQRTATMVKSATTNTTSDVAVWTPTIGKRYRLLKYQIIVSANATLSSAGNLTITLKDGANATGISYLVPLGTTSSATSPQLNTGQIDCGVGVGASTVNRVLNVALSSALAAGFVQVLAFGSEE